MVCGKHGTVSQGLFLSTSPLQNFDRDLSEFLAAKNSKISKSCGDSCRDLGEISKSQRPKTRRESRRDLGEISGSQRPKTC